MIALLAPALEAPGAVLVDATLGLGGHAEHALSTFPALHLVGLDRDPEALRLSGQRLAPFGERVTLVHAVYDELPEVLAELGLDRVQGILFDLGVSSMQLDEADRGFAYAQDAPLDMRMDPTTGADGRRCPEHLPRRRPGPHPARVRRGAVRQPHRRAGRGRAQGRAVHDVGPTGRR